MGMVGRLFIARHFDPGLIALIRFLSFLLYSSHS